jgi:hypothetical protein
MTGAEGIGDVSAAMLNKRAPTLNAYDVVARAVGGQAGVAVLNGVRLTTSLGGTLTTMEKGAELAVLGHSVDSASTVLGWSPEPSAPAPEPSLSHYERKNAKARRGIVALPDRSAHVRRNTGRGVWTQGRG